MSSSGSQPDPSVLLSRLRRAERIAALIGLAVAVLSVILLWSLAASAGTPPSPNVFFFSIGLGCIAAMATQTIWSFTLSLPLAAASGADRSSLKQVRRAVLADDTAALDADQAALAPRWAAVSALNLRAQLFGSVLLVVGLACMVVVPQLSDEESHPLTWVVLAILVFTLAVDIVLLRQQRALQRFATRTGAWGL